MNKSDSTVAVEPATDPDVVGQKWQHHHPAVA